MHKKTDSFKLEFSDDQHITAHAGLPLFSELYQKLGVDRVIDESFPRPGSHNGYTPNEYIKGIALMLIAGGQKIEDIRELESDKTLQSLTGLRKLPGSDAIGKYIKRGSKRKTSGVQRATTSIAQKVLRQDSHEDYTLDPDAFEIISEKGEAKKDYKGNYGYMPMAAFVAELGLCVASEFRSGNINPATRNLEIIKESVRVVREAGKTIKRLRLDSAGYQADIINYCEASGLKYTITATRDEAVMKGIGQIKNWTRFEDQEIGEIVHCMDQTEAFRLVVLRRKTNNQLSLGLDGEPASTEDYHYHAIATNYIESEKDNKEVVAWHRKRSNSENYNKEVKSGIGLEYLPTGQYKANELWYWIGLLAYNLVIAAKRLLLKGTWIKKQLKTLRWQLINTAGKFLRHARSRILRISGIVEEHFEAYALARIRCMYLRGG